MGVGGTYQTPCFGKTAIEREGTPKVISEGVGGVHASSTNQTGEKPEKEELVIKEKGGT